MFILSGRKIAYRSIGYVAGFCQMCRKPSAFELRCVGAASHVHNISFGEGALVGYERKCETCEVSVEAGSTSYASIASERASVAELTERTFPRLAESYRAAIELDQLACCSPGSLTAAERRTLVRAPMLLLSSKVERRFESALLDWEVGYAVLAVIAALLLGVLVLRRVAPESLEVSMLAILTVGIGVIIW